MNINVTLIIQACNFLIAYLMLRFLLLKPVVGVIRQDQAQMDGLVGQLNEKRKALLALEQTRQEQWRKAQQEFHNRMPVIEAQISSFKELSLKSQIEFATEQQIKQLEEELVGIIIQKVDHAHH